MSVGLDEARIPAVLCDLYPSGKVGDESILVCMRSLHAKRRVTCTFDEN